MMGSNMIEFFSNLDGLHDHMKASPIFGYQVPPSFRCVDSPNVIFHFYSDRRHILHYYAGIVKAVANLLFNIFIDVKLQASENKASNHHLFHIKPSKNNQDRKCTLRNTRASYSNDPKDSKIGVSTFCETFPFHVVFDRRLKITQMGTALMKMFAADMVHNGLLLETYFKIIKPIFKEVSFSKLLSRVNFAFVLETKSKTQVIYLFC